MSETVTYAGKMKEIELLDNTLLDTVKALAVVFGDADYSKLGDDIHEILCDHLEDKYELVGDKLFKMVSLKRFTDGEEINMGSRNPDGTIDFLTQFYNGGCCLNEALEEVLKYVDE